MSDQQVNTSTQLQLANDRVMKGDKITKEQTGKYNCSGDKHSYKCHYCNSSSNLQILPLVYQSQCHTNQDG